MTSRNFTNFFKALKSHMTTLAASAVKKGDKDDFKAKFAEKWQAGMEDLHELIFSHMPIITASGSMEGVLRLDSVDAEGNPTRKVLNAKIIYKAALANDKKKPIRTPLALTAEQKKANKDLSDEEKNAQKKVALADYESKVKARMEKLSDEEKNMYAAIGHFLSDMSKEEQNELYGYQKPEKAKGKPKVNSLNQAWPTVKAAWDALGEDGQAEYLGRVTNKGAKKKAPKRNINVILKMPHIREKLLKERATTVRKTSSGPKLNTGDMNLTALTLFKQLMREDKEDEEPMEYPAERAGISKDTWVALRKAVAKEDSDKHNKRVNAVWARITDAKPKGIYKGVKQQLSTQATALKGAFETANEDLVAEVKAQKAKAKADREAKKASSKPSSKTPSRKGSRQPTPAATDDEAEESAEEATPAPKPKKSSKAKPAEATPAPKTKVSKSSKAKKAPEPEPEEEDKQPEEEPEEMPETQAFEDIPDASDVEQENEEPEPAPTKPTKSSKSKSSKTVDAPAKPKKSSKGKAILTQPEEEAVLDAEN